jgi:hypothetical protein
MRPIFLIKLAITLLALIWILNACSKSDISHQPPGNEAGPSSQTAPASSSPLAKESPATTNSGLPSAAGKLDACSLLTSDEIRSVQGESLKETKLSGGVEGGLKRSQCFFALPTFNNSISLVVTERGDGAGARDPKEFWEETFGKAEEKDRERSASSEKQREKEKLQKRNREKGEEEEREAPPQKIMGLGDEAFWTGTRVGGSLYALKGNRYIRVSVGGAGTQQAKINRSKALAQFALKRM